MKKIRIFLLVLILLFTGCGSDVTVNEAASPTDYAVSDSVTDTPCCETAVPTEAATPTETAVPTETATPTETAAPTETPSPTAAPTEEPTAAPTPETVPGPTYVIKVNKLKNTVAVYADDELIKVFTCSVGLDDSTPLGLFYTSDKYKWRSLYGGTYGQYATRIYGSILFHSVPYTLRRNDALEWEEYNKLGTAASMGCVRMTVADCKWLYDNCPSGTQVLIYEDENEALSPEPAPKIDESSPYRGWDPTDPDENNPWLYPEE